MVGDYMKFLEYIANIINIITQLEGFWIFLTVILMILALIYQENIRKIIKERKFNKEEKELLIAAAANGQFQLWPRNQSSISFIRVDVPRKDFYYPNDPAIASKYLDAFNALCKRGLITQQSDIAYILSSKGFNRARKLAKRSQLFPIFKKKM